MGLEDDGVQRLAFERDLVEQSEGVQLETAEMKEPQ